MPAALAFVLGGTVELPAAAPAPVDEDLALARRAAQGDQSAFAKLVGRYQRRVFGVALRMLGDVQEAEDLSQDVFVALHRSLKDFRGESKLSTWIYRVTRNHCLNRIKYLDRRGRKRMAPAVDAHGEDTLQSVGSEEPGPARVAAAAELGQRLEGALRTLPAEQRLLVIMREVEQLSYEEIAGATGLPEGTIKSRLHRARAALLEQMPDLTTGEP